MKATWLWLDALMLLIAAVFLVTGVGASGLWIAAIAVGIALVVLLRRPGTPIHR